MQEAGASLEEQAEQARYLAMESKARADGPAAWLSPLLLYRALGDLPLPTVWDAGEGCSRAVGWGCCGSSYRSWGGRKDEWLPAATGRSGSKVMLAAAELCTLRCRAPQRTSGQSTVHNPEAFHPQNGNS